MRGTVGDMMARTTAHASLVDGGEWRQKRPTMASNASSAIEEEDNQQQAMNLLLASFHFRMIEYSPTVKANATSTNMNMRSTISASMSVEGER